MTKKRAMVQPAPIVPGTALKLAMALKIIGNDRAYTVISIKGNTWTVHFEGDTEPKTIIFEGEKPEVL
jgi:hypothetical protein